MDKRTILVLFITIFIIFFFQMYFAPKQPEVTQPAPKKEEKVDIAPAAREAPAKNEVIITKKTESSTIKTQKDVVVETSLMRVTLTNFGGAIKSVKLTQYKEKVRDSKQKELIEDIKPYSYIPTVTRVMDGEIIDDRIFFTVDREMIRVQDTPQTLVFSGKMSDGKTIKKIYTFFHDSYTIDMKIETESTGKEKTVVDFAVISAQHDSKYTFKGPFIYKGKKLEQIEKIEKNIEVDKAFTYAGFDDGFFAFILIPDSSSHFPLTVLKTENKTPVLRSTIDTRSFSAKLFFGPKKTEVLKSLNINAEKIIDFGWFDILAKPLVLGLNYSNKVTHNYGIDIILLTIFIKIIFYPLSVKSYKSMKEMQKLQPQILKLKEKYKNDRQKLNQEMMELYKRKKINPMGGCLPILIQIPVFFALYKALSGAIEMRHAPFFLWIDDLSAPEDLYTIFVAGFGLPIRILPLFMGVTQFIQQKMTPTGADPLQEKMMLFMPIFFTFLFWGFPSGLVLYWLINNVISIAQQYYINRKVK